MILGVASQSPPHDEVTTRNGAAGLASNFRARRKGASDDDVAGLARDCEYGAVRVTTMSWADRSARKVLFVYQEELRCDQRSLRSPALCGHRSMDGIFGISRKSKSLLCSITNSGSARRRPSKPASVTFVDLRSSDRRFFRFFRCSSPASVTLVRARSSFAQVLERFQLRQTGITHAAESEVEALELFETDELGHSASVIRVLIKLRLRKLVSRLIWTKPASEIAPIRPDRPPDT